jgi:MFS family permease
MPPGGLRPPGAASERPDRDDLGVSETSASAPDRAAPPAPPSVPRTPVDRDRRFATAAFVLGGSFALTAVAGLVDAVDVIHTYDSAGLGVGHGFLFLGALATVAAGYSLGAAFAKSRRGRDSRLRTAGLLYAGGSVVALVGASVLAGEYVANHFPGAFSISWVVTALAGGVAAAAGLLFASVYSPQPFGPAALHPQRVGMVAGVAALAALLAGVSTTLLLVAYSGHYLPAGLAGGLAVETAGHFVLAGALVTVAAAFLRWGIRPGADSEYLLDRDAVLMLAAVIGSAANLLIFAGGVMQAPDANVLETGSGPASTWLKAAQALGWCAALAWTAVGLYRSSREDASRGTTQAA